MTPVPRFFTVPWLPGTIEAVTLPPLGIVILKRSRQNPELIKNELGHWDQYEEWGLLRFYWTVLTEYAIYGRFAAPVEADATNRGGKRCPTIASTTKPKYKK